MRRKTKRLPRREEGREIRQIKGKSRSDRVRHTETEKGKWGEGGREAET